VREKSEQPQIRRERAPSFYHFIESPCLSVLFMECFTRQLLYRHEMVCRCSASKVNA